MSTPTPDPPAGLPKPATEPANTPAAAPATPARDDDPEADPPLSPLRPRASSALIVLVVLAVGYTMWAAAGVVAGSVAGLGKPAGGSGVGVLTGPSPRR